MKAAPEVSAKRCGLVRCKELAGAVAKQYTAWHVVHMTMLCRCERPAGAGGVAGMGRPVRATSGHSTWAASLQSLTFCSKQHDGHVMTVAHSRAIARCRPMQLHCT